MRPFPSLFLALLLFAFGGARAQDSRWPLDFYLTFVPNIQFAPLYLAAAEGYFADEGIDLRGVAHQDEPLLVERLAINDIAFAMISGEQVIAARAQGRPLVYVYEWFQRYPVGVIVPAESDITTAAELAGRSVGIPGRFGASYSGLLALLGAHDLREDDLRLDIIGYNAPDVFCAGLVEAAVVYLNNEPLQIEQRAAAGECGMISQIRLFPVAAAADLVSNGIVTNEQTLSAQPERIAAVARAFGRGLRATIDNPAAAYLSSAAYVESLPLSAPLADALRELADDQAAFLASQPNRAAIAASRAAQYETLAANPALAADLTQYRVLLASIELWEADTLGRSELQSWQTTAATLRQMGFLSGDIDLAAAFTNDFLPNLDGE